MRYARRAAGAAALLLSAACASAPPPAVDGFATGSVFHDWNGNGRRDALEPGLRGVAVSNGREVVRSDWRGRWRLPVSDDAILFVVKPRGFRPPVGPEGLPRFYYVHKPAGSPTGRRFPGVAPSGPLPASIDFPLERRSEPGAFRVVLLADPQPYDLREIDYLARDVIDALEGVDAAFALVLGDLVGDDLALFEPLNRELARLGIPWWPVLGNHDMDFDAESDDDSDETWERVYGPPTYAFQVGRAHFLVLDDVIYAGRRDDASPGPYRGGLTERQLAFVRNYLADVPEGDLIVPAMHVPLVGPGVHNVPEAGELLALLSRFPNTLSLSGHSHVQAHHFLGREAGFERDASHHHFNVGTASGSWWRGAPDAAGIPHATMRDGAPNGHALLDVDGGNYTLSFRPARRPAAEQMQVFVPPDLRAAEAGAVEIVVNVFAGSERTRVEMRLAPAGAWTPLERVARPDPGYEAIFAREQQLAPPRGFELPPPVDSLHLWVGVLPMPAPGAPVLEVRAREPSGLEHRARRVLRID